jgi:hypothetical protein
MVAWNPPRLVVVARGLHIIGFFYQIFITLLAVPFVDALFFHWQVCHVGITPEHSGYGCRSRWRNGPGCGKYIFTGTDAGDTD